MNKLFILIILFFIAANLMAQEPKPEVGFEERLGTVIPLDLVFYDEYGQAVTLRSLLGKPVIMSFVYYRCPGICSPLLSGLSGVVDKLDLEAGKDFNIITVSFDPREDYLTASGKKKNYIDNMVKKLPLDSWKFLTGDSIAVSKLTDAVGFRFQKQGNDFMHGAGIVILSPEGKIVRYLYGIYFLPLDLKLAVIEGSEGRIGPSIAKLLKLCYSYDPAGRKYVLNVTRIAGSGIILMLIIFAAILVVKTKKKATQKEYLSRTQNGKSNDNSQS